MPFTSDEQRRILNQYLDMVIMISEKELQRMAWIDGRGEYQVDFDETCNFFLCDYKFLINDLKKFNLSDKQILTLEMFSKEFEAFADDHDYPEEFIDTPEWAKIMKRAKEVLEVFQFEGGQ